MPYADASFEAVVFDPLYMNGRVNVKESINDCYRNEGNMSHENVMAAYLSGIRKHGACS